MSLLTYKYDKQFTLESGKKLRELEIGYHTYGKLNAERNNVIWVNHALTANSDVTEWWPGLFGENELFNPEDFFIVCANVLGSPYGTTNPLSINPLTGQPYYLAFPQYTVRDVVNGHKLLADHLGINQIHTLIGGSMGGQQALEWAYQEPGRFNHLIAIATNARHSAWGVAFNESQRLAIRADRTFFGNTPDGGAKGLRAARSMALLSYRGYKTYDVTQREEDNEVADNFKASSYQRYQGEKLVDRFNAYSYWYLSKAMDSHNLARGRESIDAVLGKIKARTLIIGIKSDILFPVEEQQLLARKIPNAVYTEVDSFYGHDGFLIETEILTQTIGAFLNKKPHAKIVALNKTA
ncbi:MAG: homoserine O-acetyltransferase [Mucilaginibacter polytrichastri]|nr:homoserine O-acetyltransferase [Mucilaginibacter polytrichastri]